MTSRIERIGDKRKRRGVDNPLWRGGKSHDANGYVTITSGDRAGTREHRLVMETVLGRPLQSDEIVHHINGNKADNRPENLEVTTRAEHNRKHGTGRVWECRSCGTGKWYSPGVAARLSQEYQCRLCRYGKTW